MRNTIDKLHEQRQIKLAKEILESRGYKVTKKVKEATESYSTPGENDMVVYSDSSMSNEAQMFYSSDEAEILEFIKSSRRAKFVYDPMMDTNLSLFDFLIDVISMSAKEAEEFMKLRK